MIAAFEHLEELGVWQKARQLTFETYAISSHDDFFKDAAYRDKVRAIGVALLANLLEGFLHLGEGDCLTPLGQAKEAALAIRTELYAAVDRHYVSKITFDQLFALATETDHMIDDLINYVRKKTGV